MANETLDNFSAFTESYRNSIITRNLETLEMYTNEIKKQCAKLNINSKEYEKLPTITHSENLNLWIAFGDYLTYKLLFNHIEKNDSSRELAYLYLKMSKIVNHKDFENAAVGLAKIILDKKD